jgi:predicted permease
VLSRIRAFAAKLKGLASSDRPDRDFDDEMQAHLSLLVERHVRQGMSAQDAASAARRQFGNLLLLQEDRKQMRGLPFVENVWRGVRYGARQLRLNPGFTAVAVLSLALGIGANTAVFTLLDQLVLRLLPVKQPERLVMMWPTEPHLGNNEGNDSSSYPMYQDFQRKAEAFEFVFCRYYRSLAVTIGNNTEPVNAELVSGNYFQALGVGPALGRVFSPEADDRIYMGHPVVVLSYRYWLHRFSGDRSVVGQKILVNSYSMEIIGVAPPGFTGVDPSNSPHIWVPILMKPLMTPGEDDLGNRRHQWIQVFARLKPGYTVASARASLQPLFHQILRQELQDPGMGQYKQYDRDLFLRRREIVETAASGYSNLREEYSTALVVLMGMAGMILLIACSNVASLLVARAAARQKEMAVRLAVGAGRRTLVGHLLAESLLLSVMGAAAGLVLSVVATRTLLNMLPSDGALVMLHADPDLRILMFSTAVALATGLLFGLAPAMQATRLDLFAALKAVTGGVVGAGASARLRKALVIAQVALSFLLVVGAGLFAETLGNLRNARTGMENIGNIITFHLDPALNGYTVPRLRSFNTEVLREIRATPGVKSAAYTYNPLLLGWAPDMGIIVQGHEAKDGEDMQAYYNVVSPGYWNAMGVPLLKGREFEDSDRFDPSDTNKLPDVVVVNRAFAQHYFGEQNPVGRYIGFFGQDPKTASIRIIGEVEDSLYAGPRGAGQRQIFFSYLQASFLWPSNYYVRTYGDPATMYPALRQLIARVDRTLPIYDMKTVDRQLDETLSTERLIAFLSAVFGALATIMAALGLYGVMAFSVARRTNEIGLRLALGAGQASVLWMVLREVLVLLGAGLAIGVPSAVFLSKYVSAQLFGVAPTDTVTCLAAIAVLALVAAAAAFVPARRASAIDPIKALRYE